MKKRRTTIIALLLVAALALGIGYAAMADDLMVTGTADISVEAADEAFEADVYFSKAVISPEKGTATIGELAVGTADKDKITIDVAAGALKGKGDSVICAAEITNAGDLAALVNITNLEVSDSEYFSVTTNWSGNSAQLAAGGVADLTITIACVKTPTEVVETTFQIDFNAVPVDLLP
ncbi:MAG: hypothetical protein IKA76_08115 [Clostridia bacterium]|nr:hypothetical protein [Clostridia bacterium]